MGSAGSSYVLTAAARGWWRTAVAAASLVCKTAEQETGKTKEQTPQEATSSGGSASSGGAASTSGAEASPTGSYMLVQCAISAAFLHPHLSWCYRGEDFMRVWQRLGKNSVRGRSAIQAMGTMAQHFSIGTALDWKSA